MGTIDTLTAAAERTWLDGWTAGPVEASWRHFGCNSGSERVAAARLSGDVTGTGLYATS